MFPTIVVNPYLLGKGRGERGEARGEREEGRRDYVIFSHFQLNFGLKSKFSNSLM